MASEQMKSWPKVELHVHLQGAASVPTILGLARRHPEAGVPTDEAELRAFYDFTDFDHFIEVYIAVNHLVTTDDDVADLVVGLARDLVASNVRYAEVTVTPDAHLGQGIAPDAVADALSRGRAKARSELGVELAWVFDIPGEAGLSSAGRTIDWVERFRPEGSVGFGLGGPEIGIDRAPFAPMFRRAADLGLVSVPHAGETTGSQTVWDAVNHLGARRIGHGIGAATDPALLAHLSEHQIALEVCPTSNLRTKAVTRIDEHPLPVLVAAGVPVALNTDDPGMFDTDLNREYALVQDTFGYDDTAMAGFARAAIDFSLAPAVLKARLHADLAAAVSPA